MDSTRRILCVDDNEIDRETYKRYLRRYPEEQYLFFGASTAKEGLQQVRKVEPHCILVDYQLPDQDGLEFIQHLLHNDENCPPIVMMTGQGNEMVAAQAVSIGVADYIIKSKITAPGLYRTINHVIERWMLNNKIKTQNKNLIAANDKLEKMNQEMLRSYQALSHELKTPLTSIKEFLAILNDKIVGPINSEQQQLLQYTIESCDLLKLYINDLLEASLLDTGKIVLQIKNSSVNDMIRKAIAAVTPTAVKKKIAIADHVAENLPAVLIDDLRVIQVIINILNNAIKFTPQNGKINITANFFLENNEFAGIPTENQCKLFSRLDLSVGQCGSALTETTDAFICIAISDTGVGIPANELPKIFDRFYQVKSSGTDQVEGLGLGLNICKDLMNLQRGKILVNSKVGKGSTFSLIIPVVGARTLVSG